MDEVQSWWEVPAIAHFCYVFRAAFNLIYIEIGLEAAILNMQDPEMCISLEQLIMKLLQGCYDENEVLSVNWEEKLIELFDENCEDDENPLKDNVFAFLSPRSKVEVLFKLCEFRLDADGTLEAIKDISPEVMQARCVGKDGQNNAYWYFCDERLYKEDLSIPVKNSRHKTSTVYQGKGTKDAIKNGRRPTRQKKTKSEDNNKSWSIVCHNTSDWEALIKTFSKSKHKLEKGLAKEMKTKYLPMLEEVVSEKDRLLRKRFLELAPKRMSSRISKVQAQKKLEEQMVEEANEKRRLEMEQERIKKEAEKKKQEVEDRRKRAEARQKIIEERSKRAQQRDMMRGFDENDYNSDESDRRHSGRSRKGSAETENESDQSEDEEEDEDSNKSSSEDASQSESEQFDEGRSNKNETEGDSEDESDDSSRRSSNSNVDHSSPVRPSVIQNACNISKWNADIDSKERKIHVLRYPYSVNKRLKMDGSSYTNKPLNLSSPNESHRYHHSLIERTLNSCSKSTSPPPIIRFGFIKPQKRHLMQG
ncbi:cat eye syndrome critical region protein 2 [Trichonephila inaurata madagascariensis]|uniref:Cat eye syndrome critical region protein 2 n=1 Tax=Trichonephila inaurata madagascariensis TaxID=2747483 RepID=A0A8X6WMP5_9ARAC|nr:cat eye syndrome critical region protein 2 [Trichonephila inaurata madagascariensis]